MRLALFLSLAVLSFSPLSRSAQAHCGGDHKECGEKCQKMNGKECGCKKGDWKKGSCKKGECKGSKCKHHDEDAADSKVEEKGTADKAAEVTPSAAPESK